MSGVRIEEAPNAGIVGVIIGIGAGVGAGAGAGASAGAGAGAGASIVNGDVSGNVIVVIWIGLRLLLIAMLGLMHIQWVESRLSSMVMLD